MFLFISILLLVTSLESSIKEYFSGKFPESKMEIISLDMPANSTVIEINKDLPVKKNKNFGYVPLKCKKNDRIINQFASIKFIELKNVMISTRDIKIGEQLSEENMQLVSKDVSLLTGNFLPFATSLQKFESTQFIKKGSIVCQDMTRKIPVVKSGDQLDAYLNNGSVTVNFSVNAKNNGAVGEVITVVNNKNKNFKARIIDTRNVEIIQ